MVAAPAHPALDVQQAAQVAEHDRPAPVLATCWHLLSASRAEISPNLIEKVPPKPQQVSALGHLLELEARHLGEQRARLRLDAHLAQSGAGVVVGDRPVEAPGNLVELQHVHEEVGQLEGLRSERLRRARQRGIVVEELPVVRADHPAAGARRRDQVVAALELGDDLARRARGVGAVAGVVRRLPAAGLPRRDDDLGAAGLEQLRSRRSRSTAASGRRGR